VVPGGRRRRPGSAEQRHESTLAAYRLLDALRERYPQLILVSMRLDATMARRAVVADGISDSTRRHAEFGSLVQLLPPERLWQPAYDEPEDGTAPGYRAVAAFFGGLGLGSTCAGSRRPGLRAIHRWLMRLQGVPTAAAPGPHRCGSTPASPVLIAHGVVSPSGTRPSSRWSGGTGRRPGYAWTGWTPAATYRLQVAGPRPTDGRAVALGWASGLDEAAPRSTGQALATAGLALPEGRRGSALLLHLTAV
jgi:hypothetical protein